MRLAEWIGGLRFDDIPADVLDRARWQVMSVVAAMHAGAHTAEGLAVRRAVGSSAGAATVIPTGGRASVLDAVYINSTASMALDYDDYLYMGHTGHSAVLAAWALCEELGLSTREFVTAQVIANEVGGRIGASVVLGPQNGQAWSFIHAAAGAAVAARLYGLSVDQTAHALAIAMYQPTFTLWPGFMGPGSKVLTAAGPTVTGIRAAQLAREGLTGALSIFEHPRKGFWASFAFVPLPHMLTGLGEAWLTRTLACKQYPGCAYIDTTMDALFDVLEQLGSPAPSAVRHIKVEASLLSVEMDNLSSEHVDADSLSAVNINFSIPFNVAIGVLAGRHTAAELSGAYLAEHDGEIRAVAAKCELVHDWKMTLRVAEAFDRVLGPVSVTAALSPADYARVMLGYAGQLGGNRKNSLRLGALFGRHGAGILRLARQRLRSRGARDGPLDLGAVDFSRFEMAFPARVTVETAAGEICSAVQDVAFGAPGQQRFGETVEGKFRVEVGARMAGGRVEAALEMIRTLEDVALDALTAAVCDA